MLIGLLLTESPESLATLLASLDSSTSNNLSNRMDEIQRLLKLYKSGKVDDNAERVENEPLDISTEDTTPSKKEPVSPSEEIESDQVVNSTTELTEDKESKPAEKST
jgi:hypothetical protein